MSRHQGAFYLDDRGTFHNKVMAAGPEAYGAWAMALGRHTDGVLSLEAMWSIHESFTVWGRLVEVGLLERTNDPNQFRIPHLAAPERKALV